MIQCPLCQGAGEIRQSETPAAKRSARMRASIAARKAEGKPVGRPAGAPDRQPRERSGYLAAWDEGGSQREHAPEPAGRPRDEARRRYREFGKTDLLRVARTFRVPDAEDMSRDALVMALDARQVPVETIRKILAAGQ